MKTITISIPVPSIRDIQWARYGWWTLFFFILIISYDLVPDGSMWWRPFLIAGIGLVLQIIAGRIEKSYSRDTIARLQRAIATNNS